MARRYYSEKGRVAFSVPIIRKEQDVEGKQIERLGSFDVVAKDLIYANLRAYEKSGNCRIDHETKVHTVKYFWYTFDLETLRRPSMDVLVDELAAKAKEYFIHKAAKTKIRGGVVQKQGSPDPDNDKEYIQTEMEGICYEEVPDGTPGSYIVEDVKQPEELKKLLPPAEIEPLTMRRAKQKVAAKK